MDQEEINRQFQQYVQSWIQEHGKSRMHIGGIGIHCNKTEEAPPTIDAAPQRKFNWFTYEQIKKMEDNAFERGCPVQLNPLTKEEVLQIPIIRQTYHLMGALQKKNLRLTSNGYLPVSMVEELYEEGTQEKHFRYQEKITESGLYEARLVHKVLLSTALIAESSCKMSLTEKGRKEFDDHNALLRTIITYLFKDFDTADMFSIGDPECGNTGRLYSLWLLHHFGESWHGLRFYEKEYLKAFPFDLDSRIYSFRIFKCLFTYLGLCDKSTKYGELGTRKSALLDRMFTFEEPQKV